MEAAAASSFADSIHPPSVVHVVLGGGGDATSARNNRGRSAARRTPSPIPDNYSPLSSPPNSPYHYRAGGGGADSPPPVLGGVRDLSNFATAPSNNNDSRLSSSWSAFSSSEDSGAPSFDKAQASPTSCAPAGGGGAPFDETARNRRNQILAGEQQQQEEEEEDSNGGCCPDDEQQQRQQPRPEPGPQHRQRAAAAENAEKEPQFPVDEQQQHRKAAEEDEFPGLGTAPTDERRGSPSKPILLSPATANTGSGSEEEVQQARGSYFDCGSNNNNNVPAGERQQQQQEEEGSNGGRGPDDEQQQRQQPRPDEQRSAALEKALEKEEPQFPVDEQQQQNRKAAEEGDEFPGLGTAPTDERRGSPSKPLSLSPATANTGSGSEEEVQQARGSYFDCGSNNNNNIPAGERQQQQQQEGSNGDWGPDDEQQQQHQQQQQPRPEPQHRWRSAAFAEKVLEKEEPRQFPVDEQRQQQQQNRKATEEDEFPDLGTAPTDEKRGSSSKPLLFSPIANTGGRFGSIPNEEVQQAHGSSCGSSSDIRNDDGPEDEDRTGRGTAKAAAAAAPSTPITASPSAVAVGEAQRTRDYCKPGQLPPPRTTTRRNSPAGVVAAMTARIERQRQGSERQQKEEAAALVLPPSRSTLLRASPRPSPRPAHNNNNNINPPVSDEPPFDEKDEMQDESSIDRPPVVTSPAMPSSAAAAAAAIAASSASAAVPERESSSIDDKPDLSRRQQQQLPPAGGCGARAAAAPEATATAAAPPQRRSSSTSLASAEAMDEQQQQQQQQRDPDGSSLFPNNGIGSADENDIPMIQVLRPSTTTTANNNSSSNLVCSPSSSSSSYVNNAACNGTIATATSHTATSAVTSDTPPILAQAAATTDGLHNISSESTPNAAIVVSPAPVPDDDPEEEEEKEDPPESGGGGSTTEASSSSSSSNSSPESPWHSFEKDDECNWMKDTDYNNNNTVVNGPSSSSSPDVVAVQAGGEGEEAVRMRIISIEQRRQQQAMATAAVPLSSPPEPARENHRLPSPSSPPTVQNDAAAAAAAANANANPKQQVEGKPYSRRIPLDPPSSAPVNGGATVPPSSFVRRLDFADDENEKQPSPFEAMVETVINAPNISATPKKRQQEDAPPGSSFSDGDDGQPSESTGTLNDSLEVKLHDIDQKQQQQQQQQQHHNPQSRPRKLTNDSGAPSSCTGATSTDSAPQEYPTLVKPLDNDIGIPKGDIMLSLLSNRSNSHPEGKEETIDSTGSNPSRCLVARHAVYEAVWRCRTMRRNCDTMWLRDNAYRKPGAPSNGRTSICIDVDETRVSGGALNSLLGTQRAALNFLKYDDFEDALILFGDILQGYESFFEFDQENRLQKEKDIKRYKLFVGVSLHNIGVVHFLRGEFELAYTYFERAKLNRESSLGAGHSDHISSLIKMSLCRYALKDFPSAHAGIEEALDLARGNLNSNSLADHRQLAEILNNLACLSYMCGQTGRAMKLLEESLEYQTFAAEKSLYAGSRFSGHTATINTSVTKANMGIVGLVSNDLPMCVNALETALRDQELLLRDAHGTLISTMEYLVVANLMNGQKGKALQLLNRMLHMQADAFGSNDLRCVSTAKKIQAIRSDIDRNGTEAALDESFIQSIAPFDGNKPGKPANKRTAIFRPFKKSISRKK